MSPARYTPGAHLMLVRDGYAVALVDDSEDRITALWALGDTGTPSLLDVLGVIAGQQLSEIPDFACAVWDDRGVSCVVRGALGFEARGSAAADSWDGAGVSTWSERRLDRTDLEWLALGDDVSAVAPDLPLVAGVVRGGRLLVLAAGEQEPSADQPEPESVPPPETLPASPEAVADADPEPEPESAVEPEPVPDGEPEAELAPLDAAAEAASDSLPESTVTIVEPDEQVMDSLFGATAFRTPEDAAIRHDDNAAAPLITGPPVGVVGSTAEAAVGPSDDLPTGEHRGDHDGMTVFRSALDLAPISSAPSALSVAPVPRPAGRLVLSTGEVVTV